MNRRNNVKKWRKKREKSSKKVLKCMFLAGVYTIVSALAWVGWVYQSLPDVIYVEQGEAVSIARLPYITVQESGSNIATAGNTTQVGSYNTTLSIGGVIPLKTVRTVVADRPVVTVCGTPFGIKILSQGALIVGFTQLNTATGSVNPAKDAGLKMGDLIISMNGKTVNTNEEVAAAVEGSQLRLYIYVIKCNTQPTLCQCKGQQAFGWQACGHEILRQVLAP